MDLKDLFVKGEYFPLTDHEERIEKYVRNDKLAKGDHADVFKSTAEKHEFYIGSNFAGLIARKSSDFLFGEVPVISSGKDNKSKEQETLDRITQLNAMNRLNYQQALTCAVMGDAFYKVRFGQEYAGAFPESYDPKRIIVEAVDPKKVYPQTSPFDKSKIVAYHIAEPVQDGTSDDWTLYVESHFAGKIVYRQFELTVFRTDRFGNVELFKIGDELPEGYEEEVTGVPVPLIVHIANYNDGIDWKGQDDISEHLSLFDEINNRLSQIGSILDKHADPPIAVPTGLLQDDGEGGTYFQVAMNKVFEVMGKDDIIPQYISNSNPQLDQAFKELDMLLEFLLSATEIPAVAIGLKDSGTSGNSGLSIKWRMNSLLAKINRKRQFFEDGLKRVYMIAQMLEQYADPSVAKGEIVVPTIKFNDGLPQDDTEIANRMAIRTNGSQTLSQKTALMIMDGLSEEEAQAEIDRINEEKETAMSMVAEPSIFNDDPETDVSTDTDTKDKGDTNTKEDTKKEEQE
ncbi:phage portal protein [Bacillus cereus]|uniref:phage portal protein n=1 Tax=Bacillus cereus group TaxID=86661 RepID=UPI0022E59E6A|nr:MULTISPECIES: phage portal protein [Bacillus cereus group]MDA1509583.1 phage portal protein [Bacillus cereus group sp. TH36-2LC]MDZ4632206.1 phage portal protein [Bacillus cereus]